MKKILEDLYLQKCAKLIFRKDIPDENSVSYASTVLANMNAIGFTLSKDAYEKMCKMPSADIVNMYESIMPVLKEEVGANREYRSFYPNFPQDVMNLEEGQRFFDQFIHYVGTAVGLGTESNGKPFLPDGKEIERFPLTEKVDYKMIDSGSEEDFYKTIRNLLESQVSLSQADKDLLGAFVNIAPQKVLEKLLPESIPNKENLAHFSKLIIDKYYKDNKSFSLERFYKNTTDVLRLAVSLSGGDISLASKTKFKLNRLERKVVMNMLKGTNHSLEDMMRYPEEWKRLGEIIHPNTFPDTYVKEKELFRSVCDNVKVMKFMGKVNNLLENKDEQVLNLLKQRPGVFAERLNQCVRTFDVDKVANAFDEVAKDVSVPVLIRVKNKFEYNTNDKPFRSFNPKGGARFCKENTQENLPQETLDKIVNVCTKALENKFSQKESLGKVYIDESVKGYALPMQMRDKNEGTKSIAEGSILKSEGKNFIRPFIWWTNTEQCKNNSRVDIDLSVAFFDEDYRHSGTVSYYAEDRAAVHSADITDGGPVSGKGVAEFIDIDKAKMKEQGHRYVVFTVHSYTGQPFKSLENVSFGFMEREKQLEGQAFEPSTVKNKIDLATNGTSTCPCIYDLEKDEFIWMDRVINQTHVYSNVHNTLGGIAAELYHATQMKQPQFYDFVKIHAESRGELVDDISEANTVFALERGDIPEYVQVITPFDDTLITGEFMDDIYREKNEIKELLEEAKEELNAEIVSKEPSKNADTKMKENLGKIFYSKCIMDDDEWER